MTTQNTPVPLWPETATFGENITPPTSLVQTSDDAVVQAENSLLLALALRGVGVPVEMHLSESGPHGF